MKKRQIIFKRKFYLLLILVFFCWILFIAFKNVEKLSDIETKDNSFEIQSAINNNVGKKLIFDKKTYVISKTIKIPSNIEIDFSNSIIKRKAGTSAFDMIVNSDNLKGNHNIVIKNLIIDGNKDIDNFIAMNVNNRFSGLKLENVKNSKLENITVKGTVNGENQGDVTSKVPAAGIYFLKSKNIQCQEINGYNNDRTAIFINQSKVKINHSTTYNNLGSGISGTHANDSEYYNIVSYNNGYSNVSINGLRSKVSNVKTFGSKFSGLNVGHEGVPSDNSTISNVESFKNSYEGLTIAGSKSVYANNIIVYDNVRTNIWVFRNSNASILQNIVSKNPISGIGIRYDSGTKHILRNVELMNIEANNIKVAPNVKVEKSNIRTLKD